MERIERVREVRERLLADGWIVAPDGVRRELAPVAIGPAEGEALAQWVQREGARQTLETGLGFAVSTLFLCEGLLSNGGEVGHVAVDPYQLEGLQEQSTKYAGVGVQTLEQAGVADLVELYVEPSEVVLQRLLGEGRRFDLAFLDGNHRFEGVFLDLVYCGRLLEEGGIVFADDAQLPAVRRAAAFCVANLDWTLEEAEAEEAHEWLVLRTGPRTAFRRPFDRFVDF